MPAYRSWLTSAHVFVTVFCIALAGVTAVTLVAVMAGAPTGTLSAGFVVAALLATWRAGRLSVSMDGGVLVICNPLRDHRLPSVSMVTTEPTWHARGMPCLVFTAPDGGAVKAIAATARRHVFWEGPGGGADRLQGLVRRVVDAQSEHVLIRLPYDLQPGFGDAGTESARPTP